MERKKDSSHARSAGLIKTKRKPKFRTPFHPCFVALSFPQTEQL
jgi:hypothetical protein